MRGEATASSGAPSAAAPEEEAPGLRVKRLRKELNDALRVLHAAEGPGRADEPELFRSARVWHLLRAEPDIGTKEVARRAYSTEPNPEKARRAAAFLLRRLEKRDLVRRVGVDGQWSAKRATPEAVDVAVLRALDARLRSTEEIAQRAKCDDATTLAALRRLSLLGLVVCRNRGNRKGDCLGWCAEPSPFGPSAVLFGLDAARRGIPEVPGATERATVPAVPKAPKAPAGGRYAHRGVDPQVLRRVFCAMPPPMAAPVGAQAIAERVYGTAHTEARVHAVRCALRRLREYGLVVGSRTVDQWTQRVRGPSEDDLLVLAALDERPRTETEVIAEVWPDATAEQASGVMDSLRRLWVLRRAERRRNYHGPMHWWATHEGSTANEGAP